MNESSLSRLKRKESRMKHRKLKKLLNAKLPNIRPIRLKPAVLLKKRLVLSKRGRRWSVKL